IVFHLHVPREGCVVRVCNELSQNMNSLNKMFKYHLLEAN
ncbi:hypothetical protein KR222_006196, partial [Zaprionus bogoriensis]